MPTSTSRDLIRWSEARRESSQTTLKIFNRRDKNQRTPSAKKITTSLRKPISLPLSLDSHSLKKEGPLQTRWWKEARKGRMKGHAALVLQSPAVSSRRSPYSRRMRDVSSIKRRVVWRHWTETTLEYQESTKCLLISWKRDKSLRKN